MLGLHRLDHRLGLLPSGDRPADDCTDCGVAQHRGHHRGIQIQTDARRFAKIRGAEDHAASFT
ncbi:hypothetical protein [Streptomyces sp. NPDC006668]|uniref:hypothetical protein n=1 Tax=Streptomyces sp. NPDC006668 TaxID=3156903 RepID=UPI0033CAC122